MSQTQLAERLSIGTSQLSLIEAGKRSPSLKVLHEVAVALNIPPHLLTLLASAPEDLKEGIDQKHVEELARALLRVLITAGQQQTLPMSEGKDQPKKKRPRAGKGRKKTS